MKREILDTHRKALQVNLDAVKYGTFAEIGAGQEVARWFFRVGGAAGTVAKAMSAYDMTFSDAIYGPCDRYVSRQRLQTMLDHEFGLLLERLNAKRGDTTRFFVFADTVATRSYSRKEDGHGWLGVRFQVQPRSEPSQIIIHVRLTDKESVAEQEALGVMGVNLLHSALYHHAEPETVVVSLLDNLTTDRVEVDMIEFSGPAFVGVDNRLMALKLVQNGLTQAAMFNADGSVVQPADALYKKCILIERGSFRPVTRTTLDMLKCAQAQFIQEPRVQGEPVVTLMEMTLKNLTDGNKIDHQDFLDRADILGALGKSVLISNYAEFYKLAAYLFRYTSKMIGIVMGVPTLREIFDEKYYAELSGGILESFGRLFKNDLKLYAYPLYDKTTGALITAGNLRVAPHLRHLYAYLIENRLIESVRDFDEDCLRIFSREVLARIRSGESGWESLVPPVVADMIKQRRLLGYKGPGGAAVSLPPVRPRTVPFCHNRGMTTQGLAHANVHGIGI
ncbi:MAG TPA: TonB-dependent receptor [Methylomirabilota bacterium]|nr:TonB-dependent receptor [Methylomirabilota bacterium]